MENFSEWASVCGDAKITTVLLDRLTRQCRILEIGNGSYRYCLKAGSETEKKETEEGNSIDRSITQRT